jgi:CBS domain-containing protein
MNPPVTTLLERKPAAVHSVHSSLTVAAAVAEMVRHGIGCVVVLDGERLAGVFTERDVLRRVVGAGLDPKKTLVAQVMTLEPITIGPETTVEEAMGIMTEKRCRHLPIVDAERRVKGIISIGDATRWTVDSHRAENEHLKNYIAGGFPA